VLVVAALAVCVSTFAHVDRLSVTLPMAREARRNRLKNGPASAARLRYRISFWLGRKKMGRYQIEYFGNKIFIGATSWVASLEETKQTTRDGLKLHRADFVRILDIDKELVEVWSERLK